MTLVWLIVWLLVNMPNPELSFDPANGWSVTLLLAVAIDLLPSRGQR